MRFLILSLLCLTSFSSWAQEPSTAAEDTQGRELTDLQYQTPAQKFSLEVDYNRANTSANAYQASDGAQILGSTNTSDLADLQLAYGVTQNLMIGVVTGFAFDDNNAESNVTVHSTGFSNPALLAQYRLVEQEKQAVNLDLLVSYSPNIGSAKIASSQENGNQLRGGDLSTLSLTLGQKFTSWSYALSVMTQFYGSATATNTTTNVQTSTNSYNQTQLLALFQWKANEKFLLQGGAGLLMTSSEGTTTSFDTTSVNSYNQGIFEIAALVPFTPQYALKLGYEGALQTKMAGSSNGVPLNYQYSGSVLDLSLLMEF